MTIENLISKNYSLLFGSGQGRGTFIIIRHSDDKSTLRFVCQEGLAEYAKFKRAYRAGVKLFEAACAAEEYSA
jgi:hypothetical protein